MKDKERAQVLKMIEEGKITPEEGLHLMQALEENPPDHEAQVFEAAADSGSEKAEAPRHEVDPVVERLAEKGRRMWMIPLWVGVGITFLSASGMYLVMRSAGMNFWFYCLSLPLLLGVGVIALAAASRTSRWIFVKVEQAAKENKRPFRLTLGFPIPLRLTAWFLRTFGRYIPDLEKTSVDEILQAIEQTTSSDAPLVVNVEDDEDGDRVQVYIG